MKATIAPAMPIKAHNIQAGKNVPKTLNEGQCMATGDFMKRAKAPPESCPAGVPESATIAAGSRMLPSGNPALRPHSGKLSWECGRGRG